MQSFLESLERTMAPGAAVFEGSARSQLGYEISFMGGVIEGCSRRQASTAIDTAGAELFAASVCTGVCLPLQAVTNFVTFGVLGMQPIPLWCDNEACILIARDATSIKRVSYMARRTLRPPPHAPARLHGTRGAHQTFLDCRAAPGLHLRLALASLLARRNVAAAS